MPRRLIVERQSAKIRPNRASAVYGGTMGRRYWLDLFTGKTWNEFLNHGASISGFRERRINLAQKVQPGDYFICYLTGLSRFIGVLEVTSPCYFDNKTQIWEEEIYPVRFKVKIVYGLEPKTAVPIRILQNRLSMFKDLKSPKAWSGFFRSSPVEFEKEDADVIVEAIQSAAENPVEREYDEKRLWRSPNVYESRVTQITVPDAEALEVTEPKVERTTHEEMQWLLLKLGSDMGLDVRVARNDQNKEYNGISFQDIPRYRKELPTQFVPKAQRIVEMIDVLWLQKNQIIAAFEVEHTSSIYSGLLRMSDLISEQPNISIDLYIVAPDDRRAKVKEEVNRSTFARLDRPLPQMCRFLPYSELKKEIEQMGDRVKYMKPQYINERIAESCELYEA
ncbi:MAG: EVE domain-containing protein [Chloroflexi bacterium]|nr:EVE domain-containing protein [Chloroflexota bacterium]MBM3166857.1 EVE domain-containing protein [Chloroflexota bacterium]MBM4453775.1 EVE domain-containing protein [Chloroflexota bacterium]